MKINIILLALILLGCNNATKKKQDNSLLARTDKVVLDSLAKRATPYITWKNSKNDSLSYLIKNFVNRKKEFINKPLDTLLSKIELPIFGFYLISNYPPKDKEISGIVLKLENDLSFHNKLGQKRSPIVLNVYFKKPMVAEDVYRFVRKNKSLWTLEAKAFFKNQIVADIAIVGHKK